MSHYSPSLIEFIYPIPICQSEADLSNILSIFQHLNCKMLAVPSTTGWGIITAENMLSLVVKNCYEDKIVARQKNICTRQKVIERSRLTLKAALEPVTIGRDDTELDEFLDSFEGASWLRENKVCLIIDRQGELQGKLDRSKIIEYLAQTTSNRNKVISPPALESLLEEIVLPVKIETADGRVVCANRRWQDLFTNSPSTISKRAFASEASMNQIRQWSIERQQSNRTHRAENLPVNNSSDLFSFGIEITRTANWNYLKIPLISKLQNAKDLQYLVLATAISKSAETDFEQIAVASSISSDRILTMASHELKSPLTGILGLSSLLEGQKIGGLNQRQMQYVKLICCSGKKMMHIVDSLLQLNALSGDSSQSIELINLEFLCRQLYQETLTKLRLTEEDCHLDLEINLSQLNIELGSEIVVANKPLLWAVLSHLLTETIKNGDFEPPLIEIKSRGSVTAIEITNQNTPTVNLGLDWMIAEYLSQALHARITYASDPTSSKISLFLPKSKTEIKPYYSLPTVVSDTQHSSANANLTILCLYPEPDIIDPLAPSHNPIDLKSWSNDYEGQTNHQHRIIEADSLEQAHNLARIWRLDAIVLNGYQITLPDLYLRSLQEYEHLANLPLITLDARTTEAANQIEGLNVYPCLLPVQQCSIEDLVQVIKIAIETRTANSEQ